MRKQKSEAVIIYFDRIGKSRQIVRPQTDVGAKNKFDGNWYLLVQQITGGNYFKYELI